MSESRDYLKRIVVNYLRLGMSDAEVKDLLAILEPTFEGSPTDADLERIGYVRPFKTLADGRICAIMPMAAIDVLCVDINAWGHNDCYYYNANAGAASALEKWDGKGEPEGWFRHPPSGRRRTNGDPTREYFQP
ncbi:hypothetical protein AB3X94_37445 [Paraburkholderia sp. BR10923]|uniref:hypothetical protein n=1 Tax=Paraburkholderia sp. BR10923 TaxID=3236992 RepID=UPI0034CFBEA7